MSKQEFLAQLRKGLSGLPRQDIDERLNFYSEMIEDRIEEGFLEEEAVAAVGSVDELAAQIKAEISFAKIVKDQMIPKRRLKVWEIILLVLGAPVWLSLLIAAFAVMLSLFIVVWAVIVSLWAAFLSVIGSALGCIVGGIAVTSENHSLSGVALIGAGIVCAGLSIFLFYGCKAATKGIWYLTRKLGFAVKSCFLKKEAEL